MRKEIQFSQYRKVPILLADDGETLVSTTSVWIRNKLYRATADPGASFTRVLSLSSSALLVSVLLNANQPFV